MKITRILLAVAIVCLCVSTVFAVTEMFTTKNFTAPGGGTSNLTFSASTNVTVGINTSVSSYAANSKHLNGNRTFGTASDATKIFYTEANAAGTVLPAAPGQSGAAAFSGWKSL